MMSRAKQNVFMVKPMEETDTNKSHTTFQDPPFESVASTSGSLIHQQINPEITVEEDEHFTDFKDSSSEYLPSSPENASNTDQSSSEIDDGETLTCETLTHVELLRNEEFLGQRVDRKRDVKLSFLDKLLEAGKA
ncbi:hypothetical protein JTB14_027407 [Gonioctena quinquepunctata]|nr:hypothetical protein JTB14_027407 [Gonioctena quinquepunctata]